MARYENESLLIGGKKQSKRAGKAAYDDLIAGKKGRGVVKRGGFDFDSLVNSVANVVSKGVGIASQVAPLAMMMGGKKGKKGTKAALGSTKAALGSKNKKFAFSKNKQLLSKTGKPLSKYQQFVHEHFHHFGSLSAVAAEWRKQKRKH